MGVRVRNISIKLLALQPQNLLQESMASTTITIAYGDGIGPEIMTATLHVLKEAGAQLDLDIIEIGERVYHRGFSAGIEPAAWESLRRTKVFLKAPITTPQGGGFKSMNVTIRTALGLYANVRPCVAYAPFVKTRHPGMDVVIVRENEEDLYTGIEYQQTHQVIQSLKLISRPGCERIVRYAFDHARQNGRKKVTCFTKDNIMKQADGLFHKVFDEIAAYYPEIQNEHYIVDIGAAKLADTPGKFDVVVMPNLYGDILSDVAAQIAGSVGLAGSANIGTQAAMFEAIHGSAPSRSGQDKANPSGLLLAAVMMMVHIGQPKIAQTIHNAWLRTLEDGIHTYDIYDASISKKQAGTKAFAEAVIERLGKMPETLQAVTYQSPALPQTTKTEFHLGNESAKKELVGVDVFFDWPAGSVKTLAETIQGLSLGDLSLQWVTNRGVQVWPDGFPETFCTDHFRCRFVSVTQQPISHHHVAALLQKLAQAGLDFIKTEHLYTFDGKAAYSSIQG